MGARTAKTSDRRIRRTHRALSEALVALIGERGWDGFTVRDLCERADVGRSTFYMHFADKEDLVKGGFDEFRRTIRAQVAAQEDTARPFGFPLAVIEHAYEQRRAFRALLGKRSGQPVLRRFRELVVDLVEDDLAGVDAPKQRKGAATRFLAGGFLELLTWGLDSGSVPDPRALEDLFQQMARPVLDVLRGGAR